jgi:peptidoglycan/xylan/chitin deacetylase (PgdA/CDA1 family)
MTTREKLMVVSFIALLGSVTLVSAAPTYSSNSTNSTLAGQPTLFSVQWSDAEGLSGYIFSTKNTGTWVDDNFTSFGSTRAWNTWDATEGVLLEGFEDSSEWTVESDSSIFTDSSTYVEGSGSVGMWTGLQDNNTAIQKIINLNLSNATNFYFWFYTSDTYDLDHSEDNPAIGLYFTSDSNYSKFFSCSVFGSELKTGWNKIVIDKNNCYLDSEGSDESWNNTLVSMQFRVYLKGAATNTSINFDNLRYDYAGGTHGKAVVIMTFDDGWNTTMTAYQIMKDNNQKGVSFINPEPIDGEWEEYMSLENLTTLYADGWDISSHSMTHANLTNTSLTYDDLIYEIVESKEWLDNKTFTRSSGFFAYPYHEYNDTILSLVNSTYKMARNDFGAESQPHIYLDDPDNIPFLVKGTEILDTTTSDYIKGVIDRTIAQKGLLILSFHKIVENASEETEWSISNFEEISNYLKEKVDYGWLDVMTFSEYYSAISGFPTTAWSNVTKTLNNTVNTTVEWCVRVKDASNSWNNETCANPFSLVTTVYLPEWSNNQSIPVNKYDPNEPSEFNITWNSSLGIDTVLITIRDYENAIDILVNNESMDNSYGNGTYNYSIVLPAGTFNWTSYANDNSGKTATTDTWTFEIERADNPIYLYLNNGTEYLNQDIEVFYSTPTNVTGICTVGNCSLWRNSSDASAENDTQMILGAGTWEYILFSGETTNYSGNSTSYNITVNKGILDLSIGFSPSNPATIGQQVTVTGVENNIGDNDTVYELWRDGVLLANATPYQDVISFSVVGTHDYIFNASGGKNWTANITGVSALLTVQVPGTITYGPGGGGGISSSASVDNEDDNTTESTNTTGDSDSEDMETENQEECIEDWICSGWSDCINGTQTRTCFDTNDCGTVFNTTEESQECEEEASIMTGLFTFFTTPTGIGIMGVIATVVVFLISMTKGKMKLDFLK